MTTKIPSESGKWRTVSRLSGAAAITGIAALFFISSGALAAQTSGGVNWLEPLKYEKPQFVPITVPDEATVGNKYWVNMSGGSGSSCTQSSPCANIDNVVGKAGTAGGPAYVYVKGTGNLSLYNDTFYGSPGTEIVIKPWPAGAQGCSTECAATFTGNSNTNSTNVHDIIFDGGPNLAIKWQSDKCNNYNLHVMSNNTTVYRTQAYSTCSSGSMLFSVGDSPANSNVKFINNEGYGCNTAAGYQCSFIYAGPGPTGGYNGLLIQNNIVRDMGGEGIEINPRVTSSGLTIAGNAIHNIGFQTCYSNWQCRPGIVVGIQSGGGNNSTIIANNMIWNTGSGCYWDRGGGSPKAAFYNNTCYDYGKGSGGGGPNPQGISGYTNSGSATIRNNIVYAPNGTNPLDGSSFTASNNLCASGKSCGSSSRIWSATSVLSSSDGTSSFMQLGSASEAVDAGYAISSITGDYLGQSRPQGASYDISAFEYGTSAAGLAAPGNLRVVP